MQPEWQCECVNESWHANGREGVSAVAIITRPYLGNNDWASLDICYKTNISYSVHNYNAKRSKQVSEVALLLPRVQINMSKTSDRCE